MENFDLDKEIIITLGDYLGFLAIIANIGDVKEEDLKSVESYKRATNIKAAAVCLEMITMLPRGEREEVFSQLRERGMGDIVDFVKKKK